MSIPKRVIAQLVITQIRGKPAEQPCKHGQKLCPVCHGWGPKPGAGGGGTPS